MDHIRRTLVPWLEHNEALTNLLGHLPNPGEDVSKQRAILSTARKALEGRMPYSLPTPALVNLPAEMQDLVPDFCKRPEVVAAMHGLDWTIGMADLRQVLSFQKSIAEEQAVLRASTVHADDPRSLFSFCLPASSSELTLSGALDLDQKGITLSSSNPNLRVGGQLAIDMEVAGVPGGPSKKEKLVGFTINFGVTFVQISEYNGRWFVRDGYHRTYGLLRRGIQQIPGVFIRARSFQELGAAAPGFLPYEVLFGDRPPFLTDFLDDTVSASVSQKAFKKVVRISAEEFVVEM